MKCPKCGYNSFEYNDNCIKCSNDLVEYKQKFGLQAIVLPLHARQSMAEAMKAATVLAATETVAAEASADVFSFDLPDSQQNPPGLGKDPFDFSDEDFAPKAENKPADNLFKPSANPELSSLFGEVPLAPPAPPVQSQPKSEFDLSDFSWDEPPAAAAGQSKEPAKPTDDFSSLFGDTQKK